MIATLDGMVSEKLAEIVIIDVGGVGYGINMTVEDYGQLSAGDKTRLYIYEHIREQSHDLFGFISRDTKVLFEQLLGVNGVGPKMALNVLSIGPAQEVRQAMADGNVAYVQQAAGVGRRVAERLIVELKDKVGLSGIDLADSGLLDGDTASKDEAAMALVSLGYSAADAAKALRHIDPKLPSGDRIKQALKSIDK